MMLCVFVRVVLACACQPVMIEIRSLSFLRLHLLCALLQSACAQGAGERGAGVSPPAIGVEVAGPRSAA